MSDPGEPTALPPLRDVIAEFGLSARRSLGQHFLLDLNLTRRIARAAGPLDESTVVEIGPGPGGLTRALLETEARRVIAVERDRRAVDALRSLSAACPDRLVVVEADALDIAVPSLIAPDETCAIVANLPYNIALKLLLGWLRQIHAIRTMTLMFQKEVADRLTAPPGSAAFGRTSVVAQWLCEVRSLFDIPPGAFVPPPKVTSTVVSLVPRSAPLAPADFGALEMVTRAAFGQRRKMLRSALSTLTKDPLRLLETAGIDPTVRAETLSVEAFCALARAYADANRS